MYFSFGSLERLKRRPFQRYKIRLFKVNKQIVLTTELSKGWQYQTVYFPFLSEMSEIKLLLSGYLFTVQVYLGNIAKVLFQFSKTGSIKWRQK